MLEPPIFALLGMTPPGAALGSVLAVIVELRNLRMKMRTVHVILVGLLVMINPPAMAQEDLAKQSQNPLGTIISAPFENNFNFGIGPADATAYVLNMKPVYPTKLGRWNLINRFILPVIYTEGQDINIKSPLEVELGYSILNLAQGSAFGLGDITYQGFFSPASLGKWIWGVGPAVVLPTATKDRYASDKWSAGPAAVALTTPGKWVVGVLAQNVWSFAGDSDASNVNKFLFQYFVNYNLDDGWYLTSTPTITANWEASSGNQWTVPFGGGLGRLMKWGKLPVDLKLAAYWNAEKPEFGSDWNLQFTMKFLFPKR